MANQPFRLSIGQDVGDFGWREPYVQRHRDHTEPGTRMNELDVVGFVRQQKRQPVANAEAAFFQVASDASDPVVQLAKRRPPASGSQRRPLGVETSGPPKRVSMNHWTWSSNRSSSNSGIL